MKTGKSESSHEIPGMSARADRVAVILLFIFLVMWMSGAIFKMAGIPVVF